VLAEPLNMRPKYVASTTLVGPLKWQHSTLLRGDVADAVRALKAQDGDDLLVIGSPGGWSNHWSSTTCSTRSG
jgi:dihydrofolate reductase